jgi:Stress responsive A/B Barrel Domain
VGPELGGEFEYGAVYVVEDLDGYWAYLTHPAHVRSEMEGIPLIEKFAVAEVGERCPAHGLWVVAGARPAGPGRGLGRVAGESPARRR